MNSLVADFIFDCCDARVNSDSNLLNNDFLLNECTALLLDEINLVHIRVHHLNKVLFQIGYVFNDFL